MILGKHKLDTLVQSETSEEGLLMYVDENNKKRLKICSHSPVKGQVDNVLFN